MDTVPLWGLILLDIILILLNAFFACAEVAILSISDSKVTKLAASGNKKAVRLSAISSQPTKFLLGIQVAITLTSFIAAAFSGIGFGTKLSAALQSTSLGWSISAFNTVSLIIVTLIVAFVILVLGQLVPKKLAIRYTERIALNTSGIVSATSTLFRPFVFLINKTANGVVRLFGIDPHAEDDEVTEEEILLMVDEGTEKGVIEQAESDMISNILEFNDKTADQIMTHRIDMHSAPHTASIGEVIEIAVENGNSRVPIYEDDIDKILGICYVKDLLPYVGKELPEFVTLTDIMRPAYFVPESKKCDALFEEMTERKVQIAIVVDEYGGTAGLVTLEDLTESIFGNIQDEYDNETEEIRRVSETEFTVEGTTAIDEIEDLTGVEIPEGDYDTIGGFVIDKLGFIPKENEHPIIEACGLSFKVLKAEDQRISLLFIVKLPPKEENDDNDDD